MACHIRGLTEVPSKGHPSPCPGCPGAGGACAESSSRGLSPWHRVTALPSSATASSSPGVAEPNPAAFLPLWFGFLNNPRGCRQTEEESRSLSSRCSAGTGLSITAVWGSPLSPGVLRSWGKEPGHQNLPCLRCQPAGRSPGGCPMDGGSRGAGRRPQGRGLLGSSSRAELTPPVCSIWEVFP